MNNIYVDELPKSCSECEWFTPNHCDKGGKNFCLLARMPFYNTEEEREKSRGQHKDNLSDFDCPLKKLTDRLAEERKKIVQEIKTLLKEYVDIDVDIDYKDCNYRTITDYGLKKILDQIKRGE